MSAYDILILLSALVIFSYLFDLFAKRTRLPAVLLLLTVGMGLRLVADRWNVHIPGLGILLPTLGNIGLILIVFEGALDLTYAHSKRPLIRKAFLSALVIMLVTAGAITMLLYHALPGASWSVCLANSIPLSIISSAVAIPSAAGLRTDLKEFVIYESSFSDILGIILFNFLTVNGDLGSAAFGRLGAEIIGVLVMSAGFSMALLWLLGRIKHHVKFFLILAILVLVYAVGKQFHLSSLVVVLAFGIFLANADQLPFAWFRKRFLYADLDRDLGQFHTLARETAFLIRTFFFALFGFSVVIDQLRDRDAVLLCGGLLALTYGVRALFLAALRLQVKPLVYLTPRGLISILLFLSLPPQFALPGVGIALLFLFVLATCLIMAMGLLASGDAPKAGEVGATDRHERT